MAARLTATVRLAVVASLLAAVAAEAQPLGTFKWQLQPFCNVVTVNLTQQGAVYTMDGFDDQCGASQRAALVGLATPNADGSITAGLNLVTAPGGRGVQVAARLTLPSASGTWSDSAGNSGTFAFGASTGGNPRPAAGGSTIPNTFSLLTDGGFLARGALNAGSIPASGPGPRMMWHPGKAAFRVGNVSGGQWDDANVGAGSVAMGFDTVASGGLSTALGSNTTANGGNSTAMGASTLANGGNSTAMGFETTASGSASTAMGRSTIASGQNGTAMGHGTIASGNEASTAMGHLTTASGSSSTAMGHQTIASGDSSTAVGHLTTASGHYSTAMGIQTTASGNYSTAMGFRPIASGVSSTAMGILTVAAGLGSTAMGTFAEASAAAAGSFVYGDRSTVATTARITSAAPNQFLVRASGGVSFYTNAALTAGVALANNGSSWAPLSDVNAKENFRDVSGEEVLAKISKMSIQEWNYKSQDASFRHMGPTAQEFRAAFGLGDFPLRINTIDADGVALVAVQALEARTRDNADLRVRLAEIEQVNDELRARLARLEALLDKK